MLLAAAVMVTGVISVQASKARLDVNSSNKIELTPVSAPQGGVFKNATWGDVEKRKFYLFGETANLPNDKWTTVTFVFVPKESGNVNLVLLGAFSKQKDKKNIDQNWVYFDNVKVEGATVINGDFEEEVMVKEEPAPKGWWLSTWQKVKAVFVKDKAQSNSGNNCVMVWHNCACVQTLTVEKDKEVKITVDVRGGETILATE